AFLADALPSLLRPGCARVAVTDRGQVVGYVTREHVDVELRRRASEEVIEPPTLGWPKLSSIARRPPVDASTSAGSEPVVEQDQPARSPIQP
ncbi:MAG: hypothetical protein ACYCV7_13025, partial [Acidimicrobiales bacterium]